MLPRRGRWRAVGRGEAADARSLSRTLFAAVSKPPSKGRPSTTSAIGPLRVNSGPALHSRLNAAPTAGRETNPGKSQPPLSPRLAPGARQLRSRPVAPPTGPSGASGGRRGRPGEGRGQGTCQLGTPFPNAPRSPKRCALRVAPSRTVLPAASAAGGRPLHFNRTLHFNFSGPPGKKGPRSAGRRRRRAGCLPADGGPAGHNFGMHFLKNVRR